MNTIVTYESQHGTAKKIAKIISDKLNCKYINVDTPFEAEDLKEINNLILVFNFRGPYTAQLTKLYLKRVADKLTSVNVYLVGEGIFSEQEFPKVAEEIHSSIKCRTFNKFFVKGQLRVGILFPEEVALLNKFSELTRIEIKDMGEFKEEDAIKVSEELEELISKSSEVLEEDNSSYQGKKTKWVCPICGYIHYGEEAPEVCPLCGAKGDTFIKEEEN